MKIWFLVGLALAPIGVGAEIVDFLPRNRTSCEAQLSRPAEIIEFPQRSPVYLDLEAFLQQQKEDPRQLIFYAGGNPNPFHHQNSGEWSLLPILPHTEDLVVVRATYRRYGPPLSSHRLSLREVRVHYVLHHFTRVRIPPMFTLVQGLIEGVRAFETQTHSLSYDPILLSHDSLLSRLPFHRRLEAMVNSWMVNGGHERRVQEIIKEWLSVERPQRGDRKESAQFVAEIMPRLKEIYGQSAFLESVFEHLRGPIE